MNGWDAKEINRAHDPGEGEVGVFAHFVELVADDRMLGDAHGQKVIAGMDSIGDIHFERQGPALMIRQPPAVDPDLRSAIHPFEA